MNIYLEISHDKSGQLVKRLDVSGKSERNIGRIESGMSRNLNHKEFTICRKYTKEELETGDFEIKNW